MYSKWIGRLDVIFANVGIFEIAALDSITEEHFDKLLIDAFREINSKKVIRDHP